MNTKKFILLSAVLACCLAAMSPQKQVCIQMAKKYWERGFTDGTRVMAHMIKTGTNEISIDALMEKTYRDITNDLQTVK